MDNGTEKKKKSKKAKGFLIVLVNIAAMIAVTTILICIVFKRLDKYTRHGLQIEVPTLTGCLEENAGDILKPYGLTYQVTDFRYEAGKAYGEIIEQRPKAGSFVKEGRIIYLTVNTGKIPTKPLPDVADNSSLRAAESQLLRAGFKLTEPEYIAGDADWVYEIKMGDATVEGGTELPEGTLLTIVVGNGEPVMTIEEVDSTLLIDTEFF